ncbi:MAG TPA: transposase [Dermatophilaceae bacterium]|nr:transposase [Dermatophilaceae bacterium]
MDVELLGDAGCEGADLGVQGAEHRDGCVRAARLLAEIGDARGRFPTASSLACLARVAPSTRQSGKVKAVTFRWGANMELRDASCDFAGDSRRADPWAADLYANARADLDGATGRRRGLRPRISPGPTQAHQ